MSTPPTTSFVVSEKAIRFGLDAVKNVGHAAVESILRAREDGPIASIWDFCERVDSRAVNKRAIECLIKCGALDSTGATRKGMLEALPAAQSSGQKAQEDAQLGQGSIFDFGEQAGGASSPAQHRRAASPPPSSTAPSCWRWRRRRSAPTSPRIRWPRYASAAGPGRLQPGGARHASPTAPG